MLVFGVVATFAVATLGLLSRRLTVWWPEFWGRTSLAIAGIRIRVVGIENFRGTGSKVVIANHTSVLDVPLVAALGPEWPLCLAKAELRWFPVFNLMWWSMGQVFVDRKDPSRAGESLERIIAATRAEARTVILAPEGTRSVDGNIGKFKLGAFRIAVATGAPIVPIVIRGGGNLMPKGQWWANPGEVIIEVKPPIPTVNWTNETIREHTLATERQYRDWIAASGLSS